MTTDAFIQTVIKESFAKTTVITVAHRLNTIADYDQVIVMQRGRIVESGSPWELIQKQGMFYEMVSHTGKNAPLIIAKAKNSHEAKIGFDK
jgi:ATP-binding cassette subfamily C (CFTR/MRP) protein 4